MFNTEYYYKMGKTGILKADENVELINGEIYTLTPIRSNHAGIVKRLPALLFRSFDEMAIISVQDPIHINQWNEPEPDIALLELRPDNYFEAHPNPSDVLMIAEVSDTSYDFDRNVKLPLYASAGIPVYWIIDLSENYIEAYEEPMDDRYRKRTFYAPDDQIIFMEKPFDISEILLIK